MENLTLGKVFVPANIEQEEGISKIIKFINKGESQEWFTLQGKAGTGKTTIISQVIKHFLGKKRIVIAALSHKAKKVLYNRLKEDITTEQGIFSHSLASLLGMGFDMETGKFVKIYTKKKPPIKIMDLIIIDECSMINEEGLKLIMSEKKKTAKVVFLGDVGQLPPIRELGDSMSGKISPTFNTKNNYFLIHSVRQNDGSSIINYSNYYWENSVNSEDPEEDPIPFEVRKDTHDMFFKTSLENTIKENSDKFLLLRDIKNIDLIKVIVYKNKTREAINWYIRNLIYKEPKEYEVGDVLIFNDNYSVGDEVLIENSTEVSIVSIEEKKFRNKWDGYVLYVTTGEESWSVDVLSNKSYDIYNKHISELFNLAKKVPFGVQRSRQLKNAWDSRRRFANVDFAYALTSHKSQGSTYNNVIIIEDDILSVKPITNIEKSQSIYVALTRASEKVYVVSELNK